MSRISVWAPAASSVEVEVVGERQPMLPVTPEGWWELPTEVEPGVDYAFVLDGGEPLPDPRSPRQPYGVDGPSRTIDHAAFHWRDSDWRGAPLPGGIIYELHIGSFTEAGTFDACIERLDHLVELGVDFVEVMPVNTFPGERNWGYDGADLYAVQETYGGPAGFKRLVDACHARGLGVILDVVYNHLGPSGNYLDHFGPYFTGAHHTPWGPALNFDGPDSDEVRRFFIDNALMWVRDYHVDGLRLDAIHAIVDTSAVHILEELGARVHELAAHLGRTVVVIAESDRGDPRFITSIERGGYGLDAQWSDDFHHALHAALTEEVGGYYLDFGLLDDIAAALERGYVYIGQYSRFRRRHHGRLPVGVPGHRFLGYLQDHDQVGNRARGLRISSLVSHDLVRVAAALVLTSPFTPMLFMGEEWAASTPWQYFTDHDDPELAEAVRQGRRSEFAPFGWDPAEVPDPQDPATFERSTLDWSEPKREPHAGMLDWYRQLIALRHQRPELTDGRLDAVVADCDEDERWLVMRRGQTLVVANFATYRQAVPVDVTPTGMLLASRHGWELRDGEVELDGASVAILEAYPSLDEPGGP